MKFPVGDIVSYKGSQAKVLSVEPATPYSSSPIYKLRIMSSLDIIYANEDDLKYSESWEDYITKTSSIKCECGSKYTSFPEIHSFWCPKKEE